MAVNLAPIGNDAPFLDASGNPLSGGKLYTYTAGSTTAQSTYTTSAGSVANANPIILDSNGYPASGGNVVEIWLTAGVSYKFVLETSASVVVWTRDNISGINDTTVTIDQWVSGPAPTYISATSFSLAGDQTTDFHAGRRIKTTNSGGTIYSTIVTSAYTTLTTITVANDSGTLDSGLSAVSYGLLSADNPSTPLLADTYPIVSGSSDKTKKARFEVDGLTTATTRVYTLQDSDDTLVGRATTDTLTNKTLTSPTINSPTIATPTINTSVAGTALATQAQQETATSTSVLVAPGTQHFHPSAAKGWCKCGVAGDIAASYNVSSVTDIGTGVAQPNWTTSFSSADYAVAYTVLSAGSNLFHRIAAQATGSVQGSVANTGGTAVDPTNHFFVAFGDFA